MKNRFTVGQILASFLSAVLFVGAIPPVNAQTPAPQAPGQWQRFGSNGNPNTQAGDGKFIGEFSIVSPQAGEQLTLTPEQIQLGIITILSPKDDKENPQEYLNRAQEFRRQWSATRPRYFDQMSLVSRWYFQTTGTEATTIQALTTHYTQEQRPIITDKNEIAAVKEWHVFSEFRHDPLGDSIDPNGTDDQIIARIAKVRDRVTPQILRTTYDPAMKKEWLEKFNACLDGKRGEEAGYCHIANIYQWSRLWEYTSGKKGTVNDVEYQPTAEWQNAKGLVLYLSKSGRNVANALPCGLNPIVAFNQLTFKVTHDFTPNPDNLKCDLSPEEVVFHSRADVAKFTLTLTPEQKLEDVSIDWQLNNQSLSKNVFQQEVSGSKVILGQWNEVVVHAAVGRKEVVCYARVNLEFPPVTQVPPPSVPPAVVCATCNAKAEIEGPKGKQFLDLHAEGYILPPGATLISEQWKMRFHGEKNARVIATGRDASPMLDQIQGLGSGEWVVTFILTYRTADGQICEIPCSVKFELRKHNGKWVLIVVGIVAGIGGGLAASRHKGTQITEVKVPGRPAGSGTSD